MYRKAPIRLINIFFTFPFSVNRWVVYLDSSHRSLILFTTFSHFSYCHVRSGTKQTQQSPNQPCELWKPIQDPLSAPLSESSMCSRPEFFGNTLNHANCGVNLLGTRHFTSIWDCICISLVLFLSPQGHWAAHRRSHCLPVTFLEKQLEMYAERQDGKRGQERSGGGICGISRISFFRFRPWECILKYTTNPCVTNDTVQSPKHKDTICQCRGKKETVTPTLHSCPSW